MKIIIDVPIGRHINTIKCPCASNGKIELEYEKYSTYAIVQGSIADWAIENLQNTAVLQELHE